MKLILKNKNFNVLDIFKNIYMIVELLLQYNLIKIKKTKKKNILKTNNFLIEILNNNEEYLN